MNTLDETHHQQDIPLALPAEELSDDDLEHAAAGINKGAGGNGGSRGRNYRPPLLTGFSPNVP